MNKSFLSKNDYSKKCENCFHGSLTSDGEAVLCVKKGIMKPDYSCGKYKYDPLKRKPEKKAQIDNFREEEFTL